MGTTLLGTQACSTAVSVMLVSVVLTAALSNAPRLSIPWTKRPAKSTLNGKAGAPTPATTNLRCLPPEPNHLPVLAFKATPSSLGSGMNLPANRLSALNQQQWHMSHTTQSRSTLATVLRLVITAVVVVTATK